MKIRDGIYPFISIAYISFLLYGWKIIINHAMTTPYFWDDPIREIFSAPFTVGSFSNTIIIIFFIIINIVAIFIAIALLDESGIMNKEIKLKGFMDKTKVKK